MYRVSNVVTRTAGTVNNDLAGVNGASITSSGTYIDNILAPAAMLNVQADDTFVGTVNDLSCKKVARRGIPD